MNINLQNYLLVLKLTEALSRLSNKTVDQIAESYLTQSLLVKIKTQKNCANAALEYLHVTPLLLHSI